MTEPEGNGWSFPLFVDLRERPVLLVGDGWAAGEKARQLVEAGARVTYVAPNASAELRALAGSGQLEWQRRAYCSGDMAGYLMVIAAHSNREENEPVWREARRRNILCNSVDDPPHCDFAFPSVYRAGDLTIAVGTNGKCPALAVRLRERLEREIGPEYGEFARVLGEMREEIAARAPDFAARREIWYALVDSPALGQIKAGDLEASRGTLRALLEERAPR